MIWLVIWAKLKSGFSALLSALSKHPWQCVCLALLFATAWAWARGDRYRDRLLAVNVAQKAATTAQVAVNHEPARKSAEIAEKSNVDARVYYEQGRRAGAAYADAHRVRISCSPSPADLPGTDHPQPSDDRSGEAADMVALSRADFDLLTGNSLRLAKVQQDSQSLIDQGVAVAAVDPAFAQP